MNIDSIKRYISRRSPVMSQRGIVASSQPAASMAGIEILKAGGNAADAAVATAAALQVTQPCSTGLGGDCFCLYYNAQSSTIRALNGSGRSPKKLSLELLEEQGLLPVSGGGREAGRPSGTGGDRNTGGSGLTSGGATLSPFHAHTVTVPGAPAGWYDTVNELGRLSIGKVLEPAIRLAADGFPVEPMTAIWWNGGVEKQLSKQWHGNELLIDGRAPKAGELFRNPTLAESLTTMAREGKEPFYSGRIAEAIVDILADAGGVMSLDDLATHRSDWVEPISIEYHGYRVWECPPNGQGLAALIALNALRYLDFPFAGAQPAPDIDRYHAMTECLRLGFADAKRYIADPVFEKIPTDRLLSESYGKELAARVDPGRSRPPASAGSGPGAGDDTVYLCVVDGEGNACSFINSNYKGFGTGIVPKDCGYSLQNRGHNFSLNPGHPNRLEPGKRPYHTIIPGLITYDTGDLFAAFGVMGGFMQPQGHVQVASALIDDGIDPQAALDRHRFMVEDGDPAGDVLIEDDVSPELIEGLTRRGHTVRTIGGTSRSVFGLGQVIMPGEGGVLWGGSDPRGDGFAAPLF